MQTFTRKVFSLGSLLKNESLLNVPQNPDSNSYQVLQLLRKCIRATDKHSKSLQSRYGITIPQQVCLMCLCEEGSLSISKLAKRVQLSPSTVVGIVDRLEKRGLLSRVRESKDRRVVQVQITDKARALVDSSPLPIQEKLVAGLSKLPKQEQAAIVDALQTVVSFMDIEEVDASPLLMPSEEISNPSSDRLYVNYKDTAVEEGRNTETTEKSQYKGFRIRPAEWEDMEPIAGFIRSTADWYRPFVSEKDMAEHDVDEKWKERNFKLREFFISFDKDTPIGTISIQHFGDYAYLGYIYLDKQYVGKRYGRILLSFIEQLARGRGLKGMVLIAHPEATWAVSAYEKFGFKRILTDSKDIVAWEDGMLKPYYEEGFHLYHYVL